MISLIRIRSTIALVIECDPVRQRTWPIEPVRLNGMTVAACQARPHNRLFDACKGRAGDTAATWSVVLAASR